MVPKENVIHGMISAFTLNTMLGGDEKTPMEACNLIEGDVPENEATG